MGETGASPATGGRGGIWHPSPVAGTVLFLHAHPDDESIFTGGTMLRLADAGWRVVLVVATGGELGENSPVGAHGRDLAKVRREETEEAAALLGVARVHFLGYRDSGLAGALANDHPECLWQCDRAEAAAVVAGLCGEEGADSLVTYDELGIYGHPDHVAVHGIGRAAAGLARLGTWYEATVDREYLHFVETHLVEEAALAGDLGLVRSHLGVPSVLVSTVVDVRGRLAEKRAAMAAHRSQLPESASALQLGMDHFAEVYGFEWYVRTGPPGPIEQLA